MENLIDHVFLGVSDIKRSTAFYAAALAPLGITNDMDYDGKLGPPGHQDLYGFFRNGRSCLWLQQADPAPAVAHIGFVGRSNEEVEAAYSAAIAAGATDRGGPSYRDYYHPRYYAANILDPDGYSIEFVYKDWQHD